MSRDYSIAAKVEIPEKGLYDIWEGMLLKAMDIKSNELKNYVENSQSNAHREEV